MKNDIATLALLGLATYRVTKLILEDEIASPVRNAIFKKFNPRDTKVGYLFTCPWCISVWAGAGLIALDHVAPEIGNVTQKVLAASAITGIIDTHS